MKKVGGRALPLYHLYVGGRVDGQQAHFGHIGAKIPARRSGEAVTRLIELFVAEGEPGEDPNAFFGRIPAERLKTALGSLLDIDETSARPEDFVDLGEDTAYEVTLSEGECAA
jgi:ferredoxin-nitrite reductase/sulfite reductase (ferredoxin)